MEEGAPPGREGEGYEIVGEGEGLEAFVEETSQSVDHYAHYLAKVNETNEVHATQDICNHHGVLLVKSGTRIDQSSAEKILRHRLMQPLEDQVALKDQLDGDQLSNHFHALVRRFPDLEHIHTALAFDDDFKALVYHPSLNASLRQKVTVFQARLPQQFEAAVFGAWLAALLARELGVDKETMRAAFLAGLVRDLGFLHINPDIVFKRGTLTSEEWRAIMGHVVVGNLFLSGLSGVTEDVVRAVMEHHERYDGTGYPVGRWRDQLSVLGNIVGAADTLQAIRVKQFERNGRNLMDAHPYLQLNTGKHSDDVGDAMLNILNRSGLKMTCQDDQEIAVIAGKVQDRLVTLQRVVPVLSKLLELAEEIESPKGRERSLILGVTNALGLVARSGLDREELVDWARSAEYEPQPGLLEELNEMELLGNELYWQFRSVYRSCTQLCDSPTTDGAHRSAIAAVCGELGQILSA